VTGSISTWSETGARGAVDRSLRARGYRLAYGLVIVERDLSGYRCAPRDFRGYRSYQEVWYRSFLAVFARALEGSGNRYVDRRDPARVFAAMVNEGDPRWWLVAFEDAAPVGVVMPRPGVHGTKTGSMSFVGVVPEARGRGLGVGLHADGLALLARIGMNRYVDTTDVVNGAMLRVFAINGCRRAGVERVYRA
jgi:GNAT superfamily N-acetyltransferase